MPRNVNVGALTNIDTKAFQTKRNALKAKCTKRTRELAEPKEYEHKHIRENPYAISPSALKAKPSPRILKLAQPRKPSKADKNK